MKTVWEVFNSPTGRIFGANAADGGGVRTVWVDKYACSHIIYAVAQKYQYLKSFEVNGLKLHERMGGGMLPGLHEKGYEKIQGFFEDAARDKKLGSPKFWRREWLLTDKTTGEKFRQEFAVTREDIEAYLAWKDNAGRAGFMFENFGDFMMFWGGASKIGNNMLKNAPIITTASPCPHSDFAKWVKENFCIVHFNLMADWESSEKRFKFRQQTLGQYDRDMGVLSHLEMYMGRSIPYHEMRVQVPTAAV
jgi:hypothetical protein